MTACFSTFFGGNGHVRKVTLSPSFGTNSPSMLKWERKEKLLIFSYYRLTSLISIKQWRIKLAALGNNLQQG